MTQNALISKALREKLTDLHTRLAALEAKRKPALMKGPPQATDAFASRMLVSALAAGFTRTIFTRCEPFYYDRPLEYRRGFLHAASTNHLTKSIVLHNTRYVASDEPPSHPLRGRYLCCVFPYTAKMDSDILRDLVRKELAKTEGKAPSAKLFNFRLAGECVEITGYEPNAVTPLGLKTPMPVVLAKQIAELNPSTFWLGGGEVSLKWRVEREEFVTIFKPFILDFAITQDA